MWPKVIAQLFELMPHISRLVPMAEKYFSVKPTAERGNEAALSAMSEGIRGDLGQITQAHSSLHRQLQDQSTQIAALGEQVRLTQLAMEQREHRIELLQQKVVTLSTWVKAGTAIVVLLLIAILIITVRLH